MNKYYRNCNELSIHSFSKVLETNNYAWLLVDFDEYKDVKFDEKEASEIWQKIFEEYSKLTEDNKALLFLAIHQQLIYLRTRYEVARTLLMQLVNGVEKKDIRFGYFKALAEWNYNINTEKPLHEELERMFMQLKASTNKINIKQSELDDLKVNEGEKLSIIEQGLKLELALDKNDINLKTTSVTKFIAMFKEVRLRNEARKKNNGK